MTNLILLIVKQKQLTTVASIYICILIAYLEMHQWEEGLKTLNLLETIPLSCTERTVMIYLSKLLQNKECQAITELIAILNNV